MSHETSLWAFYALSLNVSNNVDQLLHIYRVLNIIWLIHDVGCLCRNNQFKIKMSTLKNSCDFQLHNEGKVTPKEALYL